MTHFHITQGEYAIGSTSETIISTLLGSCVSCCLWDPVIGVGGMNHILLARSNSDVQMPMRSGTNAMEILINALIKVGAERSNLRAKAFGGARMIKGLSDIGAQNSDFILGFLAHEDIPLVTHSFGGSQARNLKFWPATGRVLQKLTDTEVRAVETAPPVRTVSDIELF